MTKSRLTFVALRPPDQRIGSVRVPPSPPLLIGQPWRRRVRTVLSNSRAGADIGGGPGESYHGFATCARPREIQRRQQGVALWRRSGSRCSTAGDGRCHRFAGSYAKPGEVEGCSDATARDFGHPSATTDRVPDVGAAALRLRLLSRSPHTIFTTTNPLPYCDWKRLDRHTFLQIYGQMPPSPGVLCSSRRQ